jgi:hypothetical protein
LFPGDTPEHKYLRTLGQELLGRPNGCTGDNTPYSIDYGEVNAKGALAYKQATGQKPTELLETPAVSRYFLKKGHRKNGFILAFSAPVLEYLLGLADVTPSKYCLPSCLTAGL